MSEIIDFTKHKAKKSPIDKSKELKAQIEPHIRDRDTVKRFLESMGIDINKSYQFVNDTSMVISDKGYISQFGTVKGFSGGDILDYIQFFLRIGLVEAIKLVADFLSIGTHLEPKIEPKKPKYDIKNIYNQMKLNGMPSGLISKIIDIDILKQCSNVQTVLKDMLVYDKYNKSLAIVLKENDEIRTIAIQHAKDKEGKPIKWKTLGDKKYIPHRLNSDYIFCCYGMKEAIICRLFELDYMIFQSDSIAKGIKDNLQFQNEIKPKLKHKNLFLLLDNDKSCRDTIKPIKEELEDICNIIKPIEMQDLIANYVLSFGGYDVDVNENFDFMDFVNYVKDISKIEKLLEDEIREGLSNA
ncbi:hypothetical protein JHD49_03420 [Sulfurimonas sp. SAG-AH-194-C21]|nr:hypothetical protein [Sulfurimonas sp. SAG-AH-194-C21]MDF1882979.1 hypothetical protein [Sulfurimonas sp. SAG-AH-194-C21]